MSLSKGEVPAVEQRDSVRYWWADERKRTDEADLARDPANLARPMLDDVLPIQILLRCPEWFAPAEGEEAKEITPELLKNEKRLRGLKMLPLLVAKIEGYVGAGMDPVDIRDNVDPKRANPAMGILTPATSVLLDREEYEERRAVDSPVKVRTSSYQYGVRMEDWLGASYWQIAENALSIMRVIKRKKRIGQDAAVIRAEFARSVLMEISEKEAKVRQIARLDEKAKVLPMETATVFALGNLVRVYLGENIESLAPQLEEKRMNKLIEACLQL